MAGIQGFGNVATAQATAGVGLANQNLLGNTGIVAPGQGGSPVPNQADLFENAGRQFGEAIGSLLGEAFKAIAGGAGGAQQAQGTPPAQGAQQGAPAGGADAAQGAGGADAAKNDPGKALGDIVTALKGIVEKLGQLIAGLKGGAQPDAAAGGAPAGGAGGAEGAAGQKPADQAAAGGAGGAEGAAGQKPADQAAAGQKPAEAGGAGAAQNDQKPQDAAGAGEADKAGGPQDAIKKIVELLSQLLKALMPLLQQLGGQGGAAPAGGAQPPAGGAQAV